MASTSSVATSVECEKPEVPEKGAGASRQDNPAVGDQRKSREQPNTMLVTNTQRDGQDGGQCKEDDQ